MSDRFKLSAEDYSEKVTTFKNSFDGTTISANVSKTSKCPGLIVNKYVDKANQLAKLILQYQKLVQKDGVELNSMVNDLMRQEEAWASAINEGASDYSGRGGGFSSAGGGEGSFGGGSGGAGFR